MSPLNLFKTDFKKIVIAIFVISVIFLYYFYDAFDTFVNISSAPSIAITTSTQKSNHPDWLPINECFLEEVDPWEPLDERYFKVPTKKKNKCKPKTILSQLENGILTVNVTGLNCSHRCLNYLDDKSKKDGNWTLYKGPCNVKCDWVEVSCDSKNSKQKGYHYMHAQIFSNTTNKATEREKYNVYILGLDGVSHGEFHRTMPKTSYFIENELQGINFKYLSKVGQNSVPNQMAALFGQRFISAPHAPEGYPRFAMSNRNVCREFHSKDDQFIGFIYNDNGYRTAHIDDMLPLVQAYPNCKGFGFAHTNHSTVPLTRSLNSNKHFKTAVMYEMCKQTFHMSAEFFETYVKAKTLEKKFGYTMLTEPSHESINDPYLYDEYFYRMIKNVKHDLDDSFLFVWSDHGHHFGDYYYTDRGQTDTRNAMLTVILPKALRENPAHPLVQNLRKNAQTLVSQYDIFPTLVDLATANFNDPASFSTHVTLKDLQKLNKRIHEVHGDSLLRPLTHRTPTCAGLGIPFTFCLCRWPLFTPPDEEKLKAVVIKQVPVLMNNFINSVGAKNICQIIEVNSKSKIEVKEVAVRLVTESNRMLRTRFSITNFHDSHAYNFQVFFELAANGSTSLTGRIYRYDGYWAQGKCLTDEYEQHFCYCK